MLISYQPERTFSVALKWKDEPRDGRRTGYTVVSRTKPTFITDIMSKHCSPFENSKFLMDREESTLVEATDSPLYGTRLRKNVLRERRSEVMASQLELMATLYSLETVVRMVKLGLAE
jgi:hypothetical protein